VVAGNGLRGELLAVQCFSLRRMLCRNAVAGHGEFGCVLVSRMSQVPTSRDTGVWRITTLLLPGALLLRPV
jgi:hypothetical protein